MTPSAHHDPVAILASLSAWWETCGVDVEPIAVPSHGKAKTPRSSAQSANPQSAGAPKKALPPLEKAKPKAPARPAPSADFTAVFAKARAMAGAAPTLDALKQAVQDFDAGDLSANASRAVFARGNPDAKLMVIGEAPSREDDQSGLPFSGQNGALLDKMLGAIGLNETSTYITTVSNWRALNTRSLSLDELALCAPIIARHIELAAPDFILLMGSAPLEALCAVKGMMKARGQWQSITSAGRDIAALPTYHPSFLLKSPELKRDAWRDLLALKARLNG